MAGKTAFGKLQLLKLIRVFRKRGHMASDLDPLGLWRRQEISKPFSLTDAFGKEADLISCPYGAKGEHLKLPDLISRLKAVYCGKIGVEHPFPSKINDEKLHWLRNVIEDPKYIKSTLTPAIRKKALKRLVRTTQFENFLAKKWTTEKRFGLEGLDAYVPGVLHVCDEAAKMGMKVCNIGMAHRGRLNVLTNVAGCPFYNVFKTFRLDLTLEDKGSGDVRYHLGHYKEWKTEEGLPFIISLVPNASHLESAMPLAVGKCLVGQISQNDDKGKKFLPILIHGDAAFAGQGVCCELTLLSNLRSSSVSGTIHVAVNNQVGFTTDPCNSRSLMYCTSLSKITGSPVLHVNAHDVDAVILAFGIATHYRYKFQSDVIVDVIGFRKFGHNEGDEPRFTQPIMYSVIDQMNPALDGYSEKLIKEGVVTKEEYNRMVESFDKELEAQYRKAIEPKVAGIKNSSFIDIPAAELPKSSITRQVYETGLELKGLRAMVKSLLNPPTFKVHPKIDELLKTREEEVMKSKAVGWSSGELMTICSLLHEGIPVRITGNKAAQGPFNRRHHILYNDNEVEVKKFHQYVKPPEGTFYSISNMPILYYASLGTELGVNMGYHKALTIWELAESGHLNTAQAVIDLYLASSESKWSRQNGLVLSIWHSARGSPDEANSFQERWLQLCTEDSLIGEQDMVKQLNKVNMVVAQPMYPATFFHLIRRHIKMGLVKPLILYIPKHFVKTPECLSNTSDFSPPSKFQELVVDKMSGIEAYKHIFCTGSIYHDLVIERARRKMEKYIAISRFDQLCPFPYSAFMNAVRRYPKAKPMWVQEEPKNMGCWHFIEPRVCGALGLNFGAISYTGSEPSGFAGDWKGLKERSRVIVAEALK